MNIQECIKDFLVELEIRKYAKPTKTRYRCNLGLFAKWCAAEGIEDMEEVRMPIVKRYTQHMLQMGRKGSYINLHLKALKIFIKYCYDEDYGGFDTTVKKIKMVREEKAIIPAFEPKHIKLMLDNCKGNTYRDIRDKAILILFFETGIRLKELLDIKETDIFDDFILINGKNSKQRMIPITPVFKKALFRFKRAKDSYFRDKLTDDNLFLSYRGKRLGNSAIDKMIKQRGQGIEGVRVSPHTCRHFFAQQQIKMGTDIYTISRLLGHENVSITQTYLNSLQDKDIINIAKNSSVLMNL